MPSRPTGTFDRPASAYFRRILRMGRLILILFLFCPGALFADGESGDSALAKQVRALVADLGDDEFTTREDAFEALRELGGRAVPYLQGAIEHDDPEVAMQVRRVIATVVVSLARVGGGTESCGSSDSWRVSLFPSMFCSMTISLPGLYLL